MHQEPAGVQRVDEPVHDLAHAYGVPAFKDHDDRHAGVSGTPLELPHALLEAGGGLVVPLLVQALVRIHMLEHPMIMTRMDR